MGELDGRPVAVSGGSDKLVRVWDLQTGVLVEEPLRGHAAAVRALALGEFDGRPIVISGGADQVCVWDQARSSTRTAEFGAPIQAIAYMPLSRIVVATARGLALLELTGDKRGNPRGSPLLPRW